MSPTVFHNQEFEPPAKLQTEEFLIRPLLISDTELDYEAVMESRDDLRLWSQEEWPEDDFTVEANREDMVKSETWYAARRAFMYTIMDPTEIECLGCVYIFPPDARWLSDFQKSAVGDVQWSDYDAVVTFWVRTSRLESQLDRRVLDALQEWLTTAWSFQNVLLYVSRDLKQQTAMVEGAGLRPMFELEESDGSAKSLAYA